MAQETIKIRGARVNNLKNISLEIPRDKLVVITGVSGSGKSSLAFDTLYAEGQRRFSESLSSYARQFLGRMTKPDVDLIEGIPPAIAIEQKVSTRNPRSTVATTTEIYDFLRLLFARIGRTYSPISGREVQIDNPTSVLRHCLSLRGEMYILAQLDWKLRDDKVELLLELKQQGYNRLLADGKPERIDDILRQCEQHLPTEAYLLVDRVRIDDNPLSPDSRTRLLSSIQDAFERGNGSMCVALKEGQFEHFSSRFELDGLKFIQSDEYLFSFNSPLGACPVCSGLGLIMGCSEELVIPDKSKSIYEDAISCWKGEKMSWFKERLIKVSQRYNIPIFKPYCQLSDEVKDIIWNGRSVEGDEESIIGINEFFEWVDSQKYKIQFKYMLSRFSGKTLCHACNGSRLRKEALWVKVGDKNIAQVLSMTISDALQWLDSLQLSEAESIIAKDAIDEIHSRLQFIENVGLAYLTLNRACNTLSGGESQRISLVTALGSSLVGSMYILDEPSIGLHPRDTERLISVLKELRDLGNSVIVVEHDEEIIRAADCLIDMGPRAGDAGGELVFQGVVGEELTQEAINKSLTLQYLLSERSRYTRTKRNWQYAIKLEGAMQHNLKDITVNFPLGVLTVVTGVSGSGKSSLVGDILYPALYRHIHQEGELPGTFRCLKGNIDRISRVEYVNQNPLGRSSRSNAVTYLKAYDDIRKLFADQQYARINGFGANSFSFNSDGGRCPECRGEGIVSIEMQFMADVKMVCDECGGKRFKSDVLEVRYRGKNIDDVLNMSVEEAIAFFDAGTEPEARSVVQKLRSLEDVGLSYLKLGQSSSTLSGGESQRIKLASFLSINRNPARKERVLFIFDEPTTGLHFHDVRKLLQAFDALLEAGHSIIVIEHNQDVIRAADWVIDLGPEAGDAGGFLVFEGTPEEMIAHSDSHTAKSLKIHKKSLTSW